MESHQTELPVKLISVEGKEREGVARIQHWGETDRMKRALKALGICWGVSLVSVILPLAHFVLVPVFFLAGPVVAYFIHAQNAMVLGGNGTCPKCEAPFEIAKKSPNWPLSDLCSACQSEVKITPAS